MLTSATQTFKPGTRLVTEGDSASRKMFIIRSGKARVYKTYTKQKITLAVLGEGEVFGEMSFFDAEARSASVEALTELTAIVLDGEAVEKDLQTMPEWVMPIFRTVFHRFREMDQQITVLQSLNEFQKRTFGKDSAAQTIYTELTRFNKALRVLYSRDLEKQGKVTSQALYEELDELLGTRSIGLRVYWRMLKEHDFMDHAKEEQESLIELNLEALDRLEAYLKSEIESERYLLLSHSAVAVLGKIVGFTRAHERDPRSGTPQGAAPEHRPDASVGVGFKEIGLERIPLHREAVDELVEREIVGVDRQTFLVDPGEMYRLYTYQRIVKAFDLAVVGTT